MVTGSLEQSQGHDGPAGYALAGSMPAHLTEGRRLAAEPVTDAAAWDRLLSQAPVPHLQQGFAYGEGKRAQGWRVERVRFLDGDRTVALCQALALGAFGVRGPARIARGPVFLAEAPPPALVRDVYQAVRRRWARPLAPLLIAPALEATAGNREALRAAGYRQRDARGFRSMRIGLERSEAEIRAALAPTFRNRLRAAERSGLALDIADGEKAAEWMIARHLENRRQKQFRGVDAGFLRALRAAAPDDHLVFRAVLADVAVAGMSVVRYGRVGEYHTGWFGPEGRGANAGNFLMWAIIRELKARGCAQFDAGGLFDGHGYTRFKRGLRGAEFTLAGEWIAF